MELKKGDKIRIKDEVSSETHSKMPPHFTEDMDELKGKVLTFVRTTPKGYLITEEVRWVLHPDWVTLVESEQKDDFGSTLKKGDKIRIKDEVSSETHSKILPNFTKDMDELKGKVLTVSHTTLKGYLITEEAPWVLRSDWVTLVESEPEDDPKSAFKEGDKIRIKDEVSSETHSKMPPHFTEDMDELKGKVLTVLGTTTRGNIVTEEIPWVLHPDWITLAESEPEDDPKSAFVQVIKELSEVLGELSDCDRVSILEEAWEILEGDRETDYGDPVANFTRIARIASSILNEDISPEQCVVVMMAVKLSREQYKHKRDNLVDLVAYTEILNRIKELNK